MCAYKHTHIINTYFCVHVYMTLTPHPSPLNPQHKTFKTLNRKPQTLYAQRSTNPHR